MGDADDSLMVYEVVINDEEQFSIWPADRLPPSGWRSVGKRGTEQECLDHIAEIWTDLRPRSLRLAEARGSD